MHAHDSSSAAAVQRSRLTLVLATTTVYLVAEVIGGLLTGSLALLADAGHMLTDVGGLALAVFAISLGSRPRTADRTYGSYRAEILAALANAVVLIGISGYILFEAYQRFRHPPPVASGAMLAVASVGLLVNALGVFLLQGGATSSLNVRGAYLEVVSDLLSSIGVIVAAAVMWATGWYYADPLVSTLIGLFIVPRTWALLREAVGVLLEGTPADVDLAAIRDAIAGLEGVADVHDLHVWSLTSGVNALSAHVVRAPEARSDEVLDRTIALLTSARFRLAHVTVQVEPVRCALVKF